jgi:thymidine phosphorylase
MAVHTLRVRRLGIDTHQQAVVYMRQDCPVCRSEGFAAEARVALAHGERAIVATLNTRPVVAAHAGRVVRIDNRRLARAAKLAGAPGDPAAGLELHAPLGAAVAAGDPLFTLHADSPGELAYALDFVNAHPNIVALEAPP